MIMAFMLVGIVTGIGSAAAAFLAGWGLFFAFLAYVIGGMGGTVLSALVSLPFQRGPGTPPHGAALAHA